MALLQQSSHSMSLPKLKTNRIPVVQHLIKDSDLADNCNSEVLRPLDLDRLVKLFVDPHSNNLTERHLHSIKKICKHYHLGFPVKDVPRIVRIFNVIADKIENDDTYVPLMINLLKIFQLPFVKEKASDELYFESIIAGCMADLGYLFRIQYKEILNEICSCILNLIKFTNVPEPYVNLQRCSKAFLLKCVRLSDLPATLVKSLTLMEDNVEIRVRTMKILQLLSKEEKNCLQMLNAECANRLINRMHYPQPHEELLFRSVEILWNLLEFGNIKQVAEQMNSLNAINHLREAFLQQLLQGFSNYDRQLRNDILVITIQLAQENPNLAFIETGFAKELLLFATYPEVKSHSPLTKRLKITTCYEDFELKKLFFNFAVTISKNTTSHQLMSDSGILMALFSFIKPIQGERDVRDWTISQFEELQLHSMATLCILIPLLMKEYFSCRGSNRLLVFLEWCANLKSDYSGYGNSFHAKGGRGSKRAQLKYCLRVIRSIVSTSNEQAIQDLADQDAMNIMIQVLKSWVSEENRASDQIDVEIESDLLFILSCLAENDLHRKELFGHSGVEILISYLKKKPEHVWNGLGYQRLIIGTIDCIWATIVGCILNEDYFIQNEGIFYLLDILEVSPKSMQNLILGCILDLCDNPKTLTHMLQWESKDNNNVSHFLCALWRDEERDIGVERDENGIILDTSKPLASAATGEVETSLPSHLPSKAIVEVSENMRAKIYGIFCRLGFTDLSGITQDDQLTLCIIENYLDFKLGEVFKEINSELKIDNIQPIPPDQEALDTILRAADDRVLTVNINQQHMANTYKQQEFMQEKEFYYEIKKNFGFKEKRMQEWNDYVARVSKYSVLMSNKEKQMAAIDDSRQPERESSVYQTIHNLEIPNLAVTAFAGQYIAIDSTPAEITGGRLKKLASMTN